MPKKQKKVPKKKPVEPTGPASTTLSANAPAGASKLEVASQAGFKAGQIIEIDAGSPLAEIHEVAGLGSIIITAPLLYPHAVGAPVNVLPDGRPIQTPAPVATTSTVIPSYQMMPTTTASFTPAVQPVSYAAPASYAAPMSYAAPATTAYAAPAYSAPYSGAVYSTGPGVAI
jgi:hypothetical protein